MINDTVRRRGLDVRLTICAIPVFAILLGLGLWQLERLEWKERLISERAGGYAAQPVHVGDIPPDDWRNHEYRRVTVRGRYLHGRTMLLQNRQRNGRNGYGIITPMLLESGSSILVDRGWVPRDWNGRSTNTDVPQGIVEATGILRGGGRPNRWIPDNEPASGLWFFVDTREMAAAADIPAPAPFIVRLLPAGAGIAGYPIPEPGLKPLPNRHLEYALTWFGLAGVLVVIYVLYHLRRQE